MKQKASGTEIILTVMTRKGIANSSCLLLFNLFIITILPKV